VLKVKGKEIQEWILEKFNSQEDSHARNKTGPSWLYSAVEIPVYRNGISKFP
jgi:hypothetical protein